MKRTLVIAILSALILAGTATAATEIQQQDAIFLDELGLFQGTEHGYELDRTMTRAEGAVMLVRLLGGEAEAKISTYQTPFTDVPDWAQPYVGWLYENKLTNGTSKTMYSPNELMRFEQYAWVTGRASGFTDDDVAAGKTHLSAEAYQREYGNEITRGQAVALSMDTLYAPLKGKGERLADRLIDDGCFTSDVWNLIRTDYEISNDIPATQNPLTYEIRYEGECPQVVCKENGVVCAISSLPDGGALYDLTITPDGIFCRQNCTLFVLDPYRLTVCDQLPLAPSATFSDTTIYGTFYHVTLIGVQKDSSTLTLYAWTPENSFRDLHLSYRPIQVDCTVQAEDGHTIYVGGPFGVLKITPDDTVAQSSAIPCHRLQRYEGSIYFIGFQPKNNQSEEPAPLSFLPGNQLYQYAQGWNLVMDLSNGPAIGIDKICSFDGRELVFEALGTEPSPLGSWVRWIVWTDGKQLVLQDLPEITARKQLLIEQWQSWLDQEDF